MNSMKRQNDRILKEKLPRSVGAQYATGDQWRNNSRKNEGMAYRARLVQVVLPSSVHVGLRARLHFSGPYLPTGYLGLKGSELFTEVRGSMDVGKK